MVSFEITSVKVEWLFIFHSMREPLPGLDWGIFRPKGAKICSQDNFFFIGVPALCVGRCSFRGAACVRNRVESER